MKIKKTINNMLDVIFASKCRICGKRLDIRKKGCICGGCWAEIKPIKQPYCMVCGKQLKEKKENFCADCTHSRLNFIDNRSAGVYEGVLKEAIHLFKYKSCRSLGPHFGKMMVDFIKENGGIDDVDCIIPVPIYKKKAKEREYNQSGILAEYIGKYFKKPVYNDVLLRAKETQPQHELDRKGRFNNVKGVFTVSNKEKIRWMCVLLVDDILTTGATADECTSVMLGSGASQIRVFTLARGI